MGIFARIFVQFTIVCQIVAKGGLNKGEDNDLNYAIVIDAGSSGSRAYLYQWPNHNANPESLLHIEPMTGEGKDPLVKSVSPGLSRCNKTPQKVGEHISPLLDFAAEKIPLEKHANTRLFILATAGMRLLNEDEQKSILWHLKKFISDNSKFECPDSNLEVISGKAEGIYQWISINYVLGKLDRSIHKSPHPRTVGALDMGGASLQVAVEIPEDQNLQSLSASDQSQVDLIDLGFPGNTGGHKYRVFVTTFLGFGANEAMTRHRRSLVLSQLDKIDSRKIVGVSPTNRVEDPCLSSGLTENLTLSIDHLHLKPQDKRRFKKALGLELKIFLKGTGNWNECFVSLSKFVRSREPYFKSCDVRSQGCPDEQISKPPVDFKRSEFFGFSEFWYTSEDVMKLGGQYSFENFKNAGQQYCQQEWPITETRYESGDYPLADLERMKTQCFKSVWVPVALHQGLGFPETYSGLTVSPNYHQGKVIHWTLGALIYKARNFHNPIPIDSNGSAIHFFVLLILATLLTFIAFYAKRLRRFMAPSTATLKMPTLSLKSSPSGSRLSPTDENGWTVLHTTKSDPNRKILEASSNA